MILIGRGVRNIGLELRPRFARRRFDHRPQVLKRAVRQPRRRFQVVGHMPQRPQQLLGPLKASPQVRILLHAAAKFALFGIIQCPKHKTDQVVLHG
jgi:hypothetical protein